MDLLNQFYNDEHTREAVKQFLLERLDGEALKRVYKGENTQGIADAQQVIVEAFGELQERYQFKKEKPAQSPR